MYQIGGAGTWPWRKQKMLYELQRTSSGKQTPELADVYELFFFFLSK